MSDFIDTSTSAAHTSKGGSSSSKGHFVIAHSRRSDNENATTVIGNQETSEETENEDVLMTVCCRSGRLGAATYTFQTGELQILEEIQDRPPEHEIFASLFHQVDPQMLVLDGKSPATFSAAVRQTVISGVGEEGKCKLIFISAKEYNFEACKRRIYSLSLAGEPPACSDDQRLVYLRTVLDFSQTTTVHALGALLRYLDLNWCNLNYDLHGKPEFLTLKRISLNDIVTIDEDTYRGLQIFNTVSHPSGFKRGVRGSNKEGLSIYQLFSKCSSKVGQRRMRIFLRHPTSDMATLRRRQAAVEVFCRPHSDALVRNLTASLRYIKNVNGILAKIKALSAKPYQWKSLYNTLYNAVLICETCEGHNNEYLDQIASVDTNQLYEMALYMNRVIDFDLSKSEGKFTVKAGVDPDLDFKKQTMASLHGLMSDTARAELDRLPLFVQECTMLYMPHLGYLLGVKAWADNLTMEDKQLPDMRFMFQNDDYIHYKSKGCEELDAVIGDTYPEIVAHETRIMMRLTTVVLAGLYALADTVDRAAELDCLLAISKVCKELNFVRPTLTTDKVIDVRAGKHPLYVTVCDTFVPNDVQSSHDAGYVKILTGPNSSGKSVYLKQIGLIVYLAHIGSFVPAERATIGLVSSIHSRIHAAECVAAHMSAFLVDLRQMSMALHGSASNSLILVDEFGKGTSSTDGLSLLAAALNTLLFREEACPHVFLSTHYLNIQQFVVETPILRFLRFGHVCEGEGGAPVFVFRLEEGAATGSFAPHVARASGIEDHVVERSATVLDAILNNKLPEPNKKIITKLKKVTDRMKQRLAEDNI
ncbi:mutS protein homolog 5-like [Aricia agestis]|uniref:mutS protein homolog 5-like n=1 Tax=Aricia agestis TaxID=91739 RepID=UPI001C203749|nr:mutS protein homolog 5-like [Aricia agestis]